VSDSNHVIQADRIVFEYRPREPVLRGVSISAAAGKLVCILGANGSGKTTLLRCLLGQLIPSSGTILLDSKPLKQHSPRQLARLMAYVPQLPTSAFAFSVRELVLMGRLAHTGLLGLAGKADLAVATEAMTMTGTLQFAGRTLEELSGGEAQCAMIARALAQQPSVMLLDEPTSHLDIKNQLTIYAMMRRLAHDWPMAVVSVSHDINLAGRFADELVLVRSGRIVAAGKPQQVIREDVLAEAYDVQIELIPAKDSPVPVVRAR